jgi:hypothetical protein
VTTMQQARAITADGRAIGAKSGGFSLEIYPGPDTFTVEAKGLGDGLGFANADQFVRSLPAEAVAHQVVHTAGGERRTLVVTAAGFGQAVLQRATCPITNEQVRVHIGRFLDWISHEVLPLLRDAAGASMTVPVPNRPTLTATELASALVLRQGWGWGRNELGRRLHAAGVLGTEGTPTEPWRDSFFCDREGWALRIDALPALEGHLAASRRTRSSSTNGGLGVRPRVPDVVWCAPNAETGTAATEADSQAALIDDLMRHLPGPDGSGPPLGITWRTGKATGTSIWREHLPGFHREIRPDAGWGDPQFRRKLAARVWSLLEFGQSLDLHAPVTSRVVYDFLISVAYDCETQS